MLKTISGYGENGPNRMVCPLVSSIVPNAIWGPPNYYIEMQKNPKWWNNQSESAWERVKAAFKRDWDQTKHDAGGNEPNTDQQVSDTVKQAAGKEVIPPRGMPNYEDAQDAYRFGYGARSQYGNRFPRWDDSLEAQLAKDWRETYTGLDWENYKEAVRRGWDYDQKSGFRKAA